MTASRRTQQGQRTKQIRKKESEKRVSEKRSAMLQSRELIFEAFFSDPRDDFPLFNYRVFMEKDGEYNLAGHLQSNYRIPNGKWKMNGDIVFFRR